MAYIQPEDLDPFADVDPAKAYAMIADATAQAILVAPCLAEEDDLDANQQAAVKSILRGAIIRWDEAGTGAFTQQQAGPFGVTYDTRQGQRKSLFWPSEIESLQAICTAVNGGSTGAFSIDTAPCGVVHAEVCSINLGANYCSCGASIAGYPLWELDA